MCIVSSPLCGAYTGPLDDAPGPRPRRASAPALRGSIARRPADPHCRVARSRAGRRSGCVRGCSCRRGAAGVDDPRSRHGEGLRGRHSTGFAGRGRPSRHARRAVLHMRLPLRFVLPAPRRVSRLGLRAERRGGDHVDFRRRQPRAPVARQARGSGGHGGCGRGADDQGPRLRQDVGLRSGRLHHCVLAGMAGRGALCGGGL
mmetsp:Transcript_44243/g.127914  ORF Transcript_44243/g.127914 Transcript_44243/m.127914 type:complete len:202 (+) Transcript_44243:16-621(+)